MIKKNELSEKELVTVDVFLDKAKNLVEGEISVVDNESVLKFQVSKNNIHYFVKEFSDSDYKEFIRYDLQTNKNVIYLINKGFLECKINDISVKSEYLLFETFLKEFETVFKSSSKQKDYESIYNLYKEDIFFIEKIKDIFRKYNDAKLIQDGSNFKVEFAEGNVFELNIKNDNVINSLRIIIYRLYSDQSISKATGHDLEKYHFGIDNYDKLLNWVSKSKKTTPSIKNIMKSFNK